MTNDENGLRALRRFWVLQFLRHPKWLDGFVRQDGFSDEQIAREIGLEDWVKASERPTEFDADQVKTRIAEMRKRNERMGLPRETFSRICPNIQKFAEKLGLKPIERDIILLLCFFEQDPIVTKGWLEFCSQGKRHYLNLLADLLTVPARQLNAVLGPQGTLIGSCILKWRRNSDSGPELRFCHGNLSQLLMDDDLPFEKLMDSLLASMPPPVLKRRDFSHLEDTLAVLVPLLRAAFRDRSVGRNVMIYGRPGIGKTEFARLLGKICAAGVFEVPFEDSDGDAISSAGRLEQLRFAQAMLRHRKALLVFEEFDEAFKETNFVLERNSHGSKRWRNKLLESNPIPTIWISNDIRMLDPAFIRRFDFVSELEAPPPSQRLRHYRRNCPETVSNRTLRKLAEFEEAAPAVVARAGAVVGHLHRGSSAGAGDDAICTLVANTLRAQGINRTDELLDQACIQPLFHPEYTNTNMPLEKLIETIRCVPFCRICCEGPPGTGKTSFGQWVAKRIGVPLLVKRASDVLSPFVGQTEKHLADIFRDAAESGAILMLDEVDTFIQDRAYALRSWEVSGVNEMLAQLEQFRGRIIASTNNPRSMDAAALRRFDLKIRFDYLTGKQSARLFLHYCRRLKLRVRRGAELTAAAAEFHRVTPGDYANVARQHLFRHFESAAEFLHAVRAETELKPDNQPKIGF